VLSIFRYPTPFFDIIILIEAITTICFRILNLVDDLLKLIILQRLRWAFLYSHRKYFPGPAHCPAWTTVQKSKARLAYLTKKLSSATSSCGTTLTNGISTAI
jgi:hypothetical protein